jgi:isopenicillin-N epimerase
MSSSGTSKNEYRDLFFHKKGYVSLNHGSFGSCPKAIMEHQFSLQRNMETLSTYFINRELKPLYKESLSGLANFLNINPQDIAFIRNATFAVNSVVSTFPFQKGDEIVTTNLIYEAYRPLFGQIVKNKGVNLKIAQLPFPIESNEQVISKILEQVTTQTKFAFLDHITSETATIFPIENLISEFRKRNIPLLVDGAHAPGMVPLDIKKLNPDYYTGNCHKWLCSPKGAAFIYIRPELQSQTKPAIVSNYFEKGDTISEQFFNSYYWSGTADYTAYCCVKPVIEYLSEVFTGGWPAIMEHNRRLVLKGRDIILNSLQLKDYTPEEMTGSMATFKLNSKTELDSKTGLDTLAIKLFDKYKIEAVIPRLHQTDERILRISAHIYNSEEDYHILGNALKELL